MESLALIEPLLPGLKDRVLIDLATQLWVENSALNSNLQIGTMLGIGDLVRTMNCYYSNLIEGHRTHPTVAEWLGTGGGGCVSSGGTRSRSSSCC